jgi:hypothetical protein
LGHKEGKKMCFRTGGMAQVGEHLPRKHASVRKGWKYEESLHLTINITEKKNPNPELANIFPKVVTL